MNILEKAIQHLRDQLEWRGSIETTRTLSSIVITREEALALIRELTENCTECDGKGYKIVAITYHGERNEYLPEKCKACNGSGIRENKS